MGSVLVLWFFKWVESPDYGRGGPAWVENHISDWVKDDTVTMCCLVCSQEMVHSLQVNIAGTMLGVPKAMSALLSGEMRDTVELNAAGVYLLEKFFSRSERAKLFRSWAGAVSFLGVQGRIACADCDLWHVDLHAVEGRVSDRTFRVQLVRW